ncbi:AraC family transcriptional regulator [Undibacterium sp.]|uniref:AraC family transcriptional regulator n=1 Tax=Undibacterium sp. TaxID=1914977 RepID=UPI00374D8E9E
MDGDGYDVRSLALSFRVGTVVNGHRHPWGQLVFAAAGVMRVVTDSTAWLTPPTRAIWVPALVPHHIEMVTPVSMRTLYLAPELAALLPTAPEVLAVAPLLRELILHILGIGMLSPEQPQQARVAGMLIDLLLTAGREDLSLPLPRDPRALKLARHWQQHPDDERDIADLCANFGGSLRTVQRLFQRETGLTVEAWRQKARLLHGMARLSSGASVTDTALASGYRSVSAFATAFRKQFGVSPGKFGQKKGAGSE